MRITLHKSLHHLAYIWHTWRTNLFHGNTKPLATQGALVLTFQLKSFYLSIGFIVGK